jgi:hypothetical protein
MYTTSDEHHREFEKFYVRGESLETPRNIKKLYFLYVVILPHTFLGSLPRMWLIVRSIVDE